MKVRCMRAPQVVSIVDDNEPFRSATARLVHAFGWIVRAFDSAEGFLDSEDVHNTAFLISDIKMPGMSGLAMYRRLLERGLAPPTVFVTAGATASLRAEVLATGAFALLEKPMDPDELERWLNHALRQP
ncbi:response regulator [Paraburkholderia sp. CNPSo 3274]|uniref:response regulator transcription factor n=1 Tax=Paraburkholderia sp. CNPSo 3274 TaxID=2940932 RepID=UPI0020B702EB|nr:response regulator [Paraburkholderia sp. CNPSo 3274]MCP3705594.1 response regulator [Paraburkholderia sp. CNPSo 3274]